MAVIGPGRDHCAQMQELRFLKEELGDIKDGRFLTEIITINKFRDQKGAIPLLQEYSFEVAHTICTQLEYISPPCGFKVVRAVYTQREYMRYRFEVVRAP